MAKALSNEGTASKESGRLVREATRLLEAADFKKANETLIEAAKALAPRRKDATREDSS